jgi:hypothetical protein
LTGLLGVPAFLATGNPFTTHNSVVLLGFIFSFLSAYALARYLTGSGGAAVLCAIGFAYCPFIYARTAHIQLLMTFGLPLSLLALHRLIDRPTPIRGVGLAAALVVQGLACAYYGVFAGLTVSLGVLYYAVSRGLWKSTRYWTAVILAAALTLAALEPFFFPYLILQEDFGFTRTLDDARVYSADWRAWLASPAHAHLWILPLIAHWNEVLFPGFLTTILGLTGIWLGSRDKPIAKAPVLAALPAAMLPVALRSQNVDATEHAVSAPRGASEREPTRETTIFYAMLGAIALWVSFGPRAGLYTALYYAIPIFSFLRAPARVGIMVSLALAVLMAIAVRELVAKTAARSSALIVTVLACALVGELTAAPLILTEAERPDPAYRRLATLPYGPLVEMPFFYLRQDYPRHAMYMLNSTYHWQPLINGYSDYIPTDFREMVIRMSSFPTMESFRLLRARKARYVAFHWNLYDTHSAARVHERLEIYKDYLEPISQTPNVWLFEIVRWPEGSEPAPPTPPPIPPAAHAAPVAQVAPKPEGTPKPPGAPTPKAQGPPKAQRTRAPQVVRAATK